METTVDTEKHATKQASTIFLRLVLIAMGLAALGLSCLILPMIYSGWEQEFPAMSHLKYPIMLVLGATLIPFFIALFQTWQLLNYIDADKAFSLLSVRALRKIKYSAATFSGLYIVFLPVVYIVAEADDAPGLVVIGMVMAGAPIAIAVLASVLEKLLRSAIAIKSENDLTV